VLLALIAAFAVRRRFDSGLPSPMGEAAIVVLLVVLLIAAQWLCWSILKFLHYQRVREIVYVLETAHTACEAGQNGIFDGLERLKRAQNESIQRNTGN
jgi:hypothetical protein